jgi:site-specific DNA-methyltransferase (adenine-specific)
MSDINHFAISSILNSEIVGRAKFGHGQIASQGDAQNLFDLLDVGGPPAVVHGNENVDVHQVVKAFHAIRNTRKDRGSSELYIADPERNMQFLAKCRELGIQGSEYAINKRLMYARKNNYLPDLYSVKTSFDHEDYAFASEFAATELNYRIGASIDDILCDPGLASEFDSIAKKLAPGFTSLEYRWAILSIRKAGRHNKLKPDFRMPEFTGRFRLVRDPVETLPVPNGVYILYEREKALYARSTTSLRHGVELHRKPQLLSAITDKLWQPNPDNLLVSYAALPENSPKSLLLPVEKRIVQEKRPIFNVPRDAA